MDTFTKVLTNLLYVMEDSITAYVQGIVDENKFLVQQIKELTKEIEKIKELRERNNDLEEQIRILDDDNKVLSRDVLRLTSVRLNGC